MTQSICGYHRGALQWVLEWAKDAHTASHGIMLMYGDMWQDIHDPTKLAAIITVPILACGFVDLSEVDFAPSYECRVRAQGDIIAVVYRFVGAYKLGCKLLDMPQARAFALALLDATTATAQDVERMIGEL